MSSTRNEVLVAGGSGVLGTAVLRALLDAGYAVTATWLLDREHEQTMATFSGADRLRLLKADVTEAADVERVVAAMPHLGAVINLVGGYDAPGRVHETEPAQFEAMLRLNLLPGFLLARATMARLAAAGGGAFVAVSARAALRPFPGAAGYITAKAALLAFIQALDAEYRDEGVRCNAILPGVIDTPANRQNQPEADFSRWVDPDAIAAVTAFLISDAAAAVTGAAVPVYGSS